MKEQILVINPGSTSTKFAVYDYDTLRVERTYFHPSDVLQVYKRIIDQLDFRKKLALEFLREERIGLETIDIFVGRGGLLKPIESGSYLINELMLDDLRNETYGSHASNLGGIIAHELATIHNKPSYIADPVVVDELSEHARVTGFKDIKRISIWHALNQKSVANKYAKAVGKKYQDLNLIIAHLGGGISVALHQKGRAVDVNNALGGDGPFSPERAGSLPSFQLLDLCYSFKYSKEELKKLLVGKGGLVSLIGTNDGRLVSRRIDDGDKEAKFYIEAMAYQINKEIGSLYFVAKGNVDAIIFTGGLVKNISLMKVLMDSLPSNLTIEQYPGENEMTALVEAVIRVLIGEEEVKKYL